MLASSVALTRRAVVHLAQWSSALVRPRRARVPPPGAVAIAAAVFLLAATIASMFWVDTPTTDWARHLPQGFVGVFAWITDFGLSGWFLYPLGFAILYLAALMSPTLPRLAQGVLAALAARCGFLFLAIALPGLFVTIVKRLIGRARPYVVVVHGHDDPFAYLPFAWRPQYASMPSGHVTTATAAAIAIGAVWPRARPIMWFYALVIMFSRIVVLAHRPSDIFAAALVGIVGALMVRRYFASRRLIFSARDLRAFPGPSWRRLKSVIAARGPGAIEPRRTTL